MTERDQYAEGAGRSRSGSWTRIRPTCCSSLKEGACPEERWQEQTSEPSMSVVAWIGRGNHVGIQPGLYWAPIVFDSDGGSGPEAIADWAAQREAL